MKEGNRIIDVFIMKEGNRIIFVFFLNYNRQLPLFLVSIVCNVGRLIIVID